MIPFRVPPRSIGLLPAMFWSFVVILAIFGGASRSDVSAQMIVRAAAGVVLTLALAVGPPFGRRYRDVGFLLAAAILVVAVQLVPLPPGVWRALPGHAAFAEADRLAGHAALWRPLSLVPDATLNALFALLVPLTTLALVDAGGAERGRGLPWAILTLAAIGSIVGFIQVIGGQFDNPFINETPSLPSGFMANRNHQAVLLALGIASLPAALLTGGRRPLVPIAVATGGGIWFTCLILATGSRAGTALAALAWAGAVAIAWPIAAPALRRLRRTVVMAMGVAGMLLVGGAVAASIRAGRALSVDRLATLEAGEDMRSRGLPVVWDILKRYFPTGTGAGSFDPVFRVHEPFALLKPTFFNHAHNDWLEVLVTTGLAGGLLLIAGTAWWLAGAWSAWRDPDAVVRRTGSLMLLMLMLASLVDYPLRTPAMMGALVIAACMASRSRQRRSEDALPADAAPL